MSGVKGRSGRLPNAFLNKRRQGVLDNEQLVQVEAHRALSKMSQMKDGDRLDFAIKFVLPIYLKSMTSKQAIVQTSVTLSLDPQQVTQLIDLAQRNSLIYKELDDSVGDEPKE